MILQGKDDFPFFEEQPGNGNGNPPPFAAPIGNYIPLMLLLGAYLIIRFFIKDKSLNKNEVDPLEEHYKNITTKKHQQGLDL